jgi:hypothetical protein
VSTPAGKLNHDLAIDPSGAGRPSAVQAGFELAAAAPTPTIVGLDPLSKAVKPGNPAAFALSATLALLIVVMLGGWTLRLRSRRT